MMNNYLKILSDIIVDGVWKENRTGIRCKTIANTTFQHRMSDGFPLLTTRKLPIRSTLVELEGFLNGITSKKWYQERGCKFWDYWANPIAVDKEYEQYLENQCFCDLCGPPDTPTKKDFQKEVDDLGPIYGYQWRKFGEDYPPFDQDETANGVPRWTGTDQLNSIVRSLKDSPNDRRMVCSAWNPNQQGLMALPPCHFVWGVIVLGDQLNLWWGQRSVDSMCGLPQNISSYATLLLLLSKHSGFKPGTLTGYLCDTHIYENHIENAYIQLEREPKQLPTAKILVEPFKIENGNLKVVWTHKDFVLSNYDPHPGLKFEVAV